MMKFVRYIDTDRPLNHRKTVWLKATVRSVRQGDASVTLEHPSIGEVECDIDDLYVKVSDVLQENAEARVKWLEVILMGVWVFLCNDVDLRGNGVVKTDIEAALAEGDTDDSHD